MKLDRGMDDLACPVCGTSSLTRVTRTVKTATEIRRERKCSEGHRFDTVEKVAGGGYLVLRRDGRIEDLQRAKIVRSIRMAGADMIPDALVDEITDKTLGRLDLQARKPVSTEVVGSTVIAQLLEAGEHLAAVRYAAKFLITRGVVTSVESFRDWIARNLPNAQIPETLPERPQYVENEGAPAKGSRREDFSILKLWTNLAIAAEGLLTTPDAAATGGEGSGYGAGWTEELLLGAILAAVLDDVRGQPTVSSRQLSAAVMRVLRATAPLAFVRVASVVKNYATAVAFAEECTGLLHHPSAPIDLASYRGQAELIVAEIASLRRGAST